MAGVCEGMIQLVNIRISHLIAVMRFVTRSNLMAVMLQKTGKAVLALKRMANLSNKSDGSDSPSSHVNGNTPDAYGTCSL